MIHDDDDDDDNDDDDVLGFDFLGVSYPNR